MATKPTEDNKDYFKRLALLNKKEVDRFTLLEYLLRNSERDRVVRAYLKQSSRTWFVELAVFLILFLTFWFFVYPKVYNYSFPLFSALTWATIFLTILAWTLVDLLFQWYYRKLRKEFGRTALVAEAKELIQESDSLLQFQLLRFRPSFLKLEYDNLVDWFTAQNIFEELVTDET